MSWIAGLSCAKGCHTEAHRELLAHMCDRLAHRGAWARKSEYLRPIQISVMGFAAAVPDNGISSLVQSDDGRFRLIYDGTLFNASDVRQTLTDNGHIFRSNRDAEVVLRAFLQWADDSFVRLRGMFAFALHDAHRQTLTLVRDPFGIKPLHYTHVAEHVFFASEFKPLIDRCSVLRPNHQAISEWFLYHSFASSESLIEDICSVPAGHFMKIKQGHPSSASPYYSPISEVSSERYRELLRQPEAVVIDELTQALDASVQDCLSIDAPVGTLCSGGVDSSLMTALAARHRQIQAFHISVPDAPRLDERRKAEQVAAHLGVPLVAKAINEAMVLQDLPQALFLNEAPLTHIQCVAFYAAARLAHAHGIKALLVGDTADSVLGGNWSRYGRQKQLSVLRRLFARLPRRVRFALELTVYAYQDMPVTRANFMPMVPHMGHFVDRYAHRGLYLQCEEAYAFVPDRVERSILATKLVDHVQGLSWFFHRGDRLGMAASVEYRVPFMGWQLIPLAVNLPWSYHTRRMTEKWSLKKGAAPFLPPTIVNQKKVPWDLPLGRFLAPYAYPAFFRNGFCLEYLGLHPKALEEMTGSYKRLLPSFFNLINLEIWGRLVFMQESPEQITKRVAQRQPMC